MKKIRLQIITLILFFVLFIWGTVFVVAYFIYPKTLDEFLKQTGIDETTDFAAQCRILIHEGDAVNLDELVNEVSKHHNYIAYSFVVNSHNKLLAHSFDTDFPADLINANKVAFQQKYHIQPLVMKNKNFFDIAVPIQTKTKQIGTAHIGIKDFIYDAIKSSLYIILPIILVTLLLTLLLSIWFANLIIKPIKILKITKEKTKEKERVYNELFNNMSSGCAVYDAVDNGDDFIFISFNKASEKMENVKKEDIIGKKITKVFPGVKEFGLFDVLKSVYKTGEAKHFPTSFYKDNDLQGWRENYVYKLPNGNIVAIYEDKTKEKNIELKLKMQNKEYLSLNEEYKTLIGELSIAKKKAEESNELKTEFIQNMSHEIRTPMNGILGFSEFLNKPNLSEEKRKQYINIINNSGKQLLRIIEDILEISKLGTKQVTVDIKPTSLNSLLLEQYSIFNIQAKQKNISFYLKKELPDNESVILTDETKLNKIISNLLENAFKFTSKGFVEFGYICKATGHAPLSRNAPLSLQIYVKDTGIGIKPESQQIIFKRFSQEEKGLSRKVGGLGLGLSICKENAELIDGEITLQSEKGKGTTFFVTIPYKPVNLNTKTGQQKDRLLQQKQFTILIAEDDYINYLYIKTLLDDFDKKLKILRAKNGKEAIEICNKNNDIDLILMDLKMPIINGIEATKKIKQFRSDLPIVAQTAYSTKEDKNKAITAGCVDFISKPINKEILYKIINNYL